MSLWFSMHIALFGHGPVRTRRRLRAHRRYTCRRLSSLMQSESTTASAAFLRPCATNVRLLSRVSSGDSGSYSPLLSSSCSNSHGVRTGVLLRVFTSQAVGSGANSTRTSVIMVPFSRRILPPRLRLLPRGTLFGVLAKLQHCPNHLLSTFNPTFK
ncbi:hypothetical protein EI94DRAFT_939624 [Lactarius quietus]|nr:hypothetical protein EI94DRAFT_939624 [Lactarius quietus]